MILVDTSVLIDFFIGIENDKSKLFEQVLQKKLPYGISVYTYQEVLQGAKTEKEFTYLKEYLSTQTIYFLQESKELYEEAAQLFFDLRRQGITIRSTIDILIAVTAIKNELFLLHDDRDFDNMASKCTDLKILNNL